MSQEFKPQLSVKFEIVSNIKNVFSIKSHAKSSHVLCWRNVNQGISHISMYMESLAKLVAIIATSLTALIAATMVWFINQRNPNLKWHWLWIMPLLMLAAFAVALLLLRVISF